MTYVSMHLRAGGGRQRDPHLYASAGGRQAGILGASWERLGSNPPKFLPKTLENPPQKLPKSYENPIHKGVQHGAQKTFVFFSLCCASWARLGRFGRHLGSVLGRLGSVLGASWRVLGDLGGVLARLGSVLGHLGRVLGRLCGAYPFLDGFLMEF